MCRAGLVYFPGIAVIAQIGAAIQPWHLVDSKFIINLNNTSKIPFDRRSPVLVPFLERSPGGLPRPPTEENGDRVLANLK